MKRLLWGFLLVNLLWTVGLADEAGYIVTDLKGIPRVEGPSDVYPGTLKLLAKLKNGTIVVDAGEKLTFTSLGDGSRITLTGPLTGRLAGKGFKKTGGRGSVEKKEGRVGSTSQLRQVSSTMGAIAVRDAAPFLVSRGPLLRRELVWVPTVDYPACKITLRQEGEVVKEWPWMEAAKLTPQKLDISDLPLEVEQPYFLTFTPLKKENGKIVESLAVVDTDIKIVNDTLADEAQEEELRARALFQEEPTDLTPLTSYLAYLVNHRLLSEAYLLVLEDSFEEQGANRIILRTALSQR